MDNPQKNQKAGGKIIQKAKKFIIITFWINHQNILPAFWFKSPPKKNKVGVSPVSKRQNKNSGEITYLF